MRTALVGVLLFALTVLAAGCGKSSWQDQVDAANRRQLSRTSDRSYLLMTWDDEPKEWLLISDLHAGAGDVRTLHTMLTFHQGHMALSTRAAILEGEEITDPARNTGFRENPTARRERYERSRSLAARGQKWTGNSQTTTISPYAVQYRDAGSVEFQGREIQLLAGEVISPRSIDPMSVYEHAHVIVGLDAASGDLVLEYLVNLRPKPAAANRMLVVHDQSPGISLRTMSERPAVERLSSYLQVYSELRTLNGSLQGQFELLRANVAAQ